MNTPDRTHWLDDPKNVKLLWRGFLVVLALTVVAEFVVPLHPYFEIEGLFGFNAVFGLIACALMIFLAKGLAVLIKRPDTYYDEDASDE